MKSWSIPIVMALSLFAIGGAFALYERDHLAGMQRIEARARFEVLSERAVRQLTQRMQVYEYGLRGTRGAVLAAGRDGITRGKFLVYSQSRELAREFPGSRGFGFIRRVPRDEEASFLVRARADGKPEFQIHQLSPQAGERLVIQYIEPEANNRAAVGLDIASEPNRRQAALEALRSGRPVLTHPITLVQAQGKTSQGFLFLLPVYEPGKPVGEPGQREQAGFGLAYTPLLIEEVLADFDLGKGEFSMALEDLGDAAATTRFFASAGAEEAALQGLEKRITLPVYGRQWIVLIKARPAFIAGLNHTDPNRLAAQMVGASALLSIVLFLVVLNVRRYRQSARDHAELAAIVENSTDAMIGLGLDGIVTSWNQGAETIFGYSAAEAIGKRLGDLIVPAEIAQEEVEILRCVGQGRSVPHRTAVRHRKDGQLIEVSITVSPIRDAAGTVVGASKTVRDVTEERHRERCFGLAIDAAGVGVWVWNLRTNQLSWDQRMFDLYGAPATLKASGLYYDFWKAHVHPDDVGMVEGKLQQHVAGTGTYDPVFRILRDDGELRWIQASATIEYDHTGRPLQMVGTNLDVTEQTLARARILELNAGLEHEVQQRTTELRHAVANAERANEAKSEFLSNMSHEIRTPMNAILGLVYLLKKQEITEESRQMADKIQAAGHTLLRIINDILDFSKIEAGRLEIENVPFRLSDVLDNLACIMGTAVRDKPVETVIGPPPAGADFLRGDALRLGQVLINLAGNAIKFTEQGEVIVSISRREAPSADTVRLRFAVRDTGIGIPQDKQVEIFKAFSQADSSTTRSYGGSGLGLTISSRLVQMMGGTLQVVSQPGKGSEFSFEISLGVSNPDHNAVPDMLHQRVLIADDQPSARAILADTVSSLGWHADVVASGIEAVDCAGRAEECPYDVLLLDWRMPGLDGLQAAQQIREKRRHGTSPVIIMVTAFDREQLLGQPGHELADIVLVKPVTSSGLYNAVQLVKCSRGELPAGAVNRVPTLMQRLEGVRVLVVDDSEINREVAGSVLQDEGALVELVEDGQIALETLAARPDGFDVVLMDMQMPVLDGYSATRQMRAMPALAQIPVIALTAGAFAIQRRQALDAGVNAFVSKPFDVDELIQTIQKLAGRPVWLAVPAASPPPDSGGPGNPDETGATPRRVMNVERALLVWKDVAGYRQYLRRFAGNYAATVATMRDAPPDEVRALAHRLGGVAGQLGLEQLAALAGQAEQELADGDGSAGLLDRLQAALDTALATIDAFAPAGQAAGAGAMGTAESGSALAPQLGLLLQALDRDDAGPIEAVLAGLAGKIPADDLAPLQRAVADYDFRGAEVLLQRLAKRLNVAIGETHADRADSCSG